MCQTRIFDIAVMEFDRPFTFEEIWVKLNEEGRGWEKDRNYLKNCIRDRIKNRKLRINPDGLYKWIGEEPSETEKPKEKKKSYDSYSVQATMQFNSLNYSYSDLVNMFILTIPDEIRNAPADSRETVYKAVENVYKKASFIESYLRTSNRISEVGSPEETLRLLADTIYDFIHSEKKSRKEFDKWHEETCSRFLNEFNTWFTDWFSANYPDKELKVVLQAGKAQKMVNLSLKYMYCLLGESYSGKFKYCHMVLDNYTYYNGYYKKEVYRGRIKDLKCWSVLNYGEYMNIQRDIIDNVPNKYGNKITPFELEFYVFNIYYFGL